MNICMISVDVEEDLGARKSFYGVENFDRILKIFDRFDISATLFVTGEILENYPKLVKKWSKKHEIASHGYYHVPLSEILVSERKKQLEDFCKLYKKIFGERPKGFRAVQGIIDDVQLELLEKFGFTYDSSVIPKYPFFRKNDGYKGRAPAIPYNPSYSDYRKKGSMKILEIPIAPLLFGFPLSGTWIRVFGPRFYKFLLMLKKPQLVSLTMHSWDCIEFEGAYSKNSGRKFLGFLDEILKLLIKNYMFANGQELIL